MPFKRRSRNSPFSCATVMQLGELRRWKLGVLNNVDVSSHILARNPPIPDARRCSKMFVQQGRSPFCARNVPYVREHGKRARTRLAAFFKSAKLVRSHSGNMLNMICVGDETLSEKTERFSHTIAQDFLRPFERDEQSSTILSARIG